MEEHDTSKKACLNKDLLVHCYPSEVLLLATDLVLLTTEVEIDSLREDCRGILKFLHLNDNMRETMEKPAWSSLDSEHSLLVEEPK